MDKKTQEQILNGKILQEIKFNNTSGMTLASLANEGESSIKNNFIAYLNGYTDNIKIHPGHDRLLVTSCGGCREALSTAGKTVHLADLITGSTDTHADRRSSLAKWINRFKLRMMRLT